jgi:hypothetical protein
LENIYRKVEINEPEKLIDKLDLEDKARKFLYLISEKFNAHYRTISEENKAHFVKIEKNDDWITHFSKNPLYEITENDGIKAIRHINSGKQILLDWDHEDDFLYGEEQKNLEILKQGFDAFKKLPLERRLQLIN